MVTHPSQEVWGVQNVVDRVFPYGSSQHTRSRGNQMVSPPFYFSVFMVGFLIVSFWLQWIFLVVVFLVAQDLVFNVYFMFAYF